MITRRDLLKASCVAALHAPQALFGRPAERRKTVAAVITEYRPSSHADVVVGRLLEGYDYNGHRHAPSVKVVSMYADQTPANDMSRDMAAKHGVQIFPSVQRSLTMDGGELAVEGVVFVGEHGDYPLNEKGQKLYPRYEFYRKIIEVFRRSGRAVPVFSDKHLSVEWEKAKWMYDQSRALGFPLMAGSSAPVTWRRPPLELDLGTPMERAVVAAHGPKESYGFHALEVLQCMVERREGGETGVAAVQCLEGAEVWKWTDASPWAPGLLEAAVACLESRTPGSVRENVKQPILFLLEYRSGLEAAVFILNGHVQGRGFAGKLRGQTEPVGTEMWSQRGKPYSHFSALAHYIEEMIVNNRAAYPVERTLLTTGVLAALMDSSYRGNRRLTTPHLDVKYQAPKQSLFSRGPVPPLES